MPYRKLPKTDAARLKALKTLLDCDDIYTVRNRFIDWKVLNRAKTACEHLQTAVEQYHISFQAQTRHNTKMEKLQRNATIYVSHFLQVLLMCVERGEMKRAVLPLYGLDTSDTSLPNIKTIAGLTEWGRKAIEGEKARVKAVGHLLRVLRTATATCPTHQAGPDRADETASRRRCDTARAVEPG